MGNDDDLIVLAGVEDGEIAAASGNASIEVKQTTAAGDGGEVDGGAVTGGGRGGFDNSRVWTMSELMTKYPGYRGYANSGLSNFAWAQAVQNKPLSEGLGKEYETRESDKIVIEDSDDEKEEGELEEGEIDLDSTVGVEMETQSIVFDKVEDDRVQKERDLETKVKLIRDVLESTSLVQAQIAFEGVCSRLLGALESLRELVSDNDDFPKRDTLMQLSFASLQTINSVFTSMNSMSKELNKETMSRLVSLVNDHCSRFLSSSQRTEIEAMNQNLRRSAIAHNAGASSEENVNRMTQTSNEGTRRGAFYARSRLPLLDLHKDHDADSLPSPTRETTPSLPVNGRHMMARPGFPFGKEGQTIEGAKVHPYESEALKAVSTYQKKFGVNSIFKTDDLPSPTPSGEPNDGNGGIGGEVSSSVVASTKPGTLMTYGQDVPLPSTFNSRSMPVASTVSSTVPPYPLSIYGMSAPTGATQTVLASDQTVKPSAKSRDPRLRLAKPDGGSVTISPKVEPSADLVNPRKQKATNEHFIDVPAWKRKKSDKDAQKAAGIGGCKCYAHECCLCDSKVPTTASTEALSSLLKDFAGNPTMLQNLPNPTMLVNFLKMGQRQTVPEKAPPKKPIDPRRAAQLPGSSVPPVPGAVKDESGSIRMKPRDPRRILFGSTLQRTDSSVEKQSKVNESSTLKGKTEVLETPSQLVPRQSISQNGTSKMRITSEPISGKTPDISAHFTKNMKDMSVVSQQVGKPLAIAHSVDLKTDKDQEESVSVSAASVTAAAGPTRSMNSWGDVEHLFEGYDDKQRVAIQKERTRRLEEQKKMFGSQKLSLVLDLDHTLLNSAKFHEVETAHEAMLRKKEEQDRDKPYRHLFRFPHMGMWTKLRPGIWNFLEKASKLYELHLYTMGNKLYATEMAKLLDPEGVLFNDPLDGDERVPKSKDLEGVMGMESSVVIIDDSVRVWPHNKMNLIVVERYTYFPCSRRQFGLLGPSLLEVDFDERPEEGTLASTLAQRKILAGCRIVFSRIFPVGEANPQLHPLWQTAEQFGAVCTTQADEHITHVVTNSLGTDKVNWALSRGKFVVHPGWVEASAFLYQRANESNFAIKP
ncbi:hypothetical protein Bca52824_010570 [Brassica carinata]|uniref:protein-serine/threonine phosphatase n=1 Tax=Brassica carinata TaxID=52824 RepID=A0A8X7WEH3_BRACI|nr:hypothetical protein Bca52824_010570 [Brassica carinata]